MTFLPRTRRALLLRALLGGVLIVGLTAGATATTGLLKISGLGGILAPHSVAVPGLTLPRPGAPETLLLIGSDHRAGDPYTVAHTDTMLLMRLDDNSSTINVMSVPRDLVVLGPGGQPVRLNSVYASERGPRGLVHVLGRQVFGPAFAVNHVIDVNFTGFSDLIDAIGCVNTMVDHRYYNRTAPGEDNYSSIDIQPGYQKLCGGVNSPTGTDSALAFVRFRHTDSDVVRNARQQDFIRWAKQGYSTAELLNDQTRLTRVFARHASTDRSLASLDGLLNLFNLILDANKLTLRTVPFPEFFGACTAGGQSPCYVYPCPDLATCSAGYVGAPPPIGQPTQATQAIWKRFITPTGAPARRTATTVWLPPASGSSGGVTAPAGAGATAPHHGTSGRGAGNGAGLDGLTLDVADGRAQARALGSVGLAIFYPRAIIGGPGAGYCSSLTGSCENPAEPATAYRGSYPRRYLLFGPGGVPHRSYVMTLVLNGPLGEYYSVEGTTWQDPPILHHPTQILHRGGRTLEVYADGGKVSLVAFHTPQAVYWVSNTLDRAIPNGRMVALAAQLTRAAPGA